MNSEHINPCLEACVETYSAMLDCKPRKEGKVSLLTGMFPVASVIGFIGINGAMRGAMMICMDDNIACKTVSRFLEEEEKEVNADVLDGIGEILNIIAGAAAAKLSQHKIGLGLPTVLCGEEPQMSADIESPWIMIPMKANELGEFSIAITMEAA